MEVFDNMTEMFDSLDGYPLVILIDPEPPMDTFHQGETQVNVQLTSQHSLSFFLNDAGLEAFAHAIVCRQKVRRLQKAEEIRQIENADGHLPGLGNRR